MEINIELCAYSINHVLHVHCMYIFFKFESVCMCACVYWYMYILKCKLVYVEGHVYRVHLCM